jgi:hypothetical protein
MKLKDISQLDFIHFNTTHPGPYRKHCENSYTLWKKQWTQTFTELNANKELCSDEFINREIGGLFLDSEPIAILFYTLIDFNDISSVDLNYFHSYEAHLIKRHSDFKDTILVASYFTSLPEWRKQNTNYSISEILVGLVTLRLKFSIANRMVVCLRNNRKINEIFYRHGGVLIQRSSAFNVEVDFSEMHKESARLSQWKDHAVLTSKLWLTFLNKHRGEKNELTRGIKPQRNEPISRAVQKTRLEQQEILL